MLKETSPMEAPHGASLDLEQVWGRELPADPSQAVTYAGIREILGASASEVLTAHGIALQPGRSVGELTIASMIGFSGEGVVGALGLATSEDALARLYQRCWAREGDDGAYSDWLRELSNQILGRVKGLLLARGLTVHLALPQSIRGMKLVPNGRRGPMVSWTVMCGEDGALLVWLDLDRTDGLALGRDAPVEARPAGDVLIF